MALLEAERTRTELSALGMQNQVLIVNAVFRATDRFDPVALAVEERANKALADMPLGLRALRRIDVPMRGFNIVGLPMVRAFLGEPEREEHRSPEPGAKTVEMPAIPTLGSIIEELADRDHGLVMGKGGVGKTTIAASIAVSLADRGRPVLLTTTDPAAHVAETLPVAVPGLSVSRIDPVAEARPYRDETYASKAPGLDAVRCCRRNCSLPVTTRSHFSSPSPRSSCVRNTSWSSSIRHPPATRCACWTRPVHSIANWCRTSGNQAAQIRHAPMILRDSEVTKVFIVTLAETTPVLEAQALQEDLRQAGIEPFAWVINASLLAATVTDPVLQQRANAEVPLIRRVAADLAKRVALVPFQVSEPTGPARLREVAGANPYSVSAPGRQTR